MSVQRIPNFPVVIVNSDWTTDANVAADIESQWGLDFGSTHTFTIDLWEGPTDPDDYATLSVAAGSPTMTDFSTMPEIGTTVFVLDIYWT